MEVDGVGEPGCEGGKGRMEASSSAPVHLNEESSANDILGPSECRDGVRDRERKEIDTESIVESRCVRGTGMDG